MQRNTIVTNDILEQLKNNNLLVVCYKEQSGEYTAFVSDGFDYEEHLFALAMEQEIPLDPIVMLTHPHTNKLANECIRANIKPGYLAVGTGNNPVTAVIDATYNFAPKALESNTTNEHSAVC